MTISTRILSDASAGGKRIIHSPRRSTLTRSNTRRRIAISKNSISYGLEAADSLCFEGFDCSAGSRGGGTGERSTRRLLGRCGRCENSRAIFLDFFREGSIMFFVKIKNRAEQSNPKRTLGGFPPVLHTQGARFSSEGSPFVRWSAVARSTTHRHKAEFGFRKPMQLVSDRVFCIAPAPSFVPRSSLAPIRTPAGRSDKARGTTYLDRALQESRLQRNNSFPRLARSFNSPCRVQ